MHFDEFNANDELLRVPRQINNNNATHFQRAMLDINYNIADCMQRCCKSFVSASSLGEYGLGYMWAKIFKFLYVSVFGCAYVN